MPNKKILATFANGVFRPANPELLGLTEEQEVELKVEPIDHATYILGLAKQVYAGLSEEEIAEIEKIIRHRPLFSREENDGKAEEVQSHGQTVE